MTDVVSIVRQRDELRIRIQHLMHLLHDSQVAFDEKIKENIVLRHALLQQQHYGHAAITRPKNVTTDNLPSGAVTIM